jgi:hypothetical protein
VIVPRFDANSLITTSALLGSTPKNARSRKREQTSYLGDFDALPSSSPQGQSTPRLQLESSFEVGRQTLRKVRAGSLTFLDSHLDSSHVVHPSDIDFDIEQIGVAISMEEDTPKRKMSQRFASPSKRSKKHPSPPRAVLAQMALQVATSGEGKEENPVCHATAGSALSTKDKNEAVKGGKDHIHGKVFAKQEMSRSAGSMPNIGAAKSLKPAIRKQATENRGNRQYREDCSQKHPLTDERMDVDELQWDKTDYNIGGRKV